MAVGDAVRRLREQRGWNQQKLADMTRCTSGTISNIETNRTPYPRIDKLMQLAAAFDLTVGRLIQLGQEADAPEPPAAVPPAPPGPAEQDRRLLAEMATLLDEGRTRGIALDKEGLVQQLRQARIRTILLAVLDSPRDDQRALARHTHALWQAHHRAGLPPTPGS